MWFVLTVLQVLLRPIRQILWRSLKMNPLDQQFARGERRGVLYETRRFRRSAVCVLDGIWKGMAEYMKHSTWAILREKNLQQSNSASHLGAFEVNWSSNAPVHRQVRLVPWSSGFNVCSKRREDTDDNVYGVIWWTNKVTVQCINIHTTLWGGFDRSPIIIRNVAVIWLSSNFQAHWWVLERKRRLWLTPRVAGRRKRTGRTWRKWPGSTVASHVQAHSYKKKRKQDNKGGCDNDDTDNAMVSMPQNNNSEKDLATAAWHTAHVDSSATAHIVKHDSIISTDNITVTALIGVSNAWCCHCESEGRVGLNWDYLVGLEW